MKQNTKPVPTQADDEPSELIQELRARRQEEFHVGRLLGQALDDRDFGHYLNFAELVKHELDMAERSAFRFIFAARMRDQMVAAGIQELPTAESQVRPLSRLPAELRLEAWRLACMMVERTPPSANVVTRALKFMGGKREPTQQTKDSVREYRQILREAGGCLARAARLTEDTEFRAFIEDSSDKMHKRIADQLEALLVTVRGQLAAIAPPQRTGPLKKVLK